MLCLRERHAFTLYASAPTLAALAMNPIFEALSADHVARTALGPGETTQAAGVTVTALDIPGKAPLYLERTRTDPLRAEPGDCYAYVLESRGSRAVFAPGVAEMTNTLAAACEGADAVFVDGTLFTDGEMIAAGEGSKSGRRMGHMPLTGPGSIVEAFAALAPKRKLLIHVNNTNPAARLNSPERAQLAQAGWEVSEDGLEVSV